jgi:hypothetical protein
MLWIAMGFVVAMMIGFLMPRKPLKLDLRARRSQLPPPQDAFAPPADSKKDGSTK